MIKKKAFFKYAISPANELENCNFVKSILMILVVFYHSALFWGGNWFKGTPVFDSAVLGTIAEWLNTFHIFGFALVSGYIFYFLKIEKAKYQEFVPFIENKAKRLLVPYVFVCLVWAIPFRVIFFKDDMDIINKFVLGTGPNQLWFLLMLFWVFVAFWCFAGFFDKHTILGSIVVCACYGISIVAPMIFPNILQIWQGFRYLAFFWIGFKFRQYPEIFLKKIPASIWLLTHIGLFTVMKFVSQYDSTIMKLLNLALTFGVCVVGSIMSFILLQKIAEKVTNKGSRLLKLLNENSMSVYLFHQQLIYVFIYLLNGVVNPYLNTGINFFGSMAISLLIAFVLKKFKITRFLIGEK